MATLFRHSWGRVLVVLLIVATLALVAVSYASADTNTVTFEQPTYVAGPIHGQDGWSSLGAAGLGCASYDHKVASTSVPGFGSQALRISNAVTSNCFSDQTFSKSLVNEAGEVSAVSNGLSVGIRQGRFEASFSLATVLPSLQAGLSMSVSPDRGDGTRMSYLRFDDVAAGVQVTFSDYRDLAPFGDAVGDSNGCSGNDNFFEQTVVTTLSRSTSHTIKFVIDFFDGPRNDKVAIIIDGVQVLTGTTWEDYFRYCEGNPTRPVDSLLFRTGGVAFPANAGNGFFIDNLTLTSSATPPSALIESLCATVKAALPVSSQYATSICSQLASAQNSLFTGQPLGRAQACTVLGAPTQRYATTVYSGLMAVIDTYGKSTSATGITPAMASAWNAQILGIRSAIPC